MKNGNEFEFAIRMAKGIAGQFGPNCEVVIHDLRGADTEHSIIAIENGHVTGRSIGDGPSHIVLESLREDPSMIEDRISYLTKTTDGKVLKSTTLFIRDDNGKAIGLMGINYDISMMLAVDDSIRVFTGREQSGAEPEAISRNVADLLDELLEHSVRIAGRHDDQRGQDTRDQLPRQQRSLPDNPLRAQGLPVLRDLHLHSLQLSR